MFKKRGIKKLHFLSKYSCTKSELNYSPDPRRKAAAETKGKEKREAVLGLGNQNDLLENTEATLKDESPVKLLENKKAKLCAAR